MACLDLFPINSFLFPAIHVIMDKYEESELIYEIQTSRF